MTRASEEALYLTDPLGSVPPAQIRAEILAAGAPPQMTKDGPKPPTKKMIANLISIELAYINTNHPDFIGGTPSDLLL